MARDDWRHGPQFGGTFASESEWNAARESLIDLGMLARNGALTVKGKNSAKTV
jgi:hypothetical protein